MVKSTLINVEVAYGRPDKQHVIPLVVKLGTTIHQALVRSGILQAFPELAVENLTVGVFGQVRAMSDVLSDQDRVEIYRSLLIDPKVARRARVKK